jgi:replication-associated recombination protein RarA
VAPELLERLKRIPGLFKVSSHVPMPFLVFEGRDGAGRTSVADAICKDLGIPLLLVNIEACLVSAEPLRKVFQALALHQCLRRAGIFLDGCENLFDREWNPIPDSNVALRELTRSRGPVFFTCAQGTPWQKILKGHRCLEFHFGDLDNSGRFRVWEEMVQKEGMGVTGNELEAIAERFTLTPSQISDVIKSAADLIFLRGKSAKNPDSEVLFEAARAQSEQSFGNLATKVETIHDWEDLVLPPNTLKQVKEVAAAAKYCHVVYTDWGFGRRIASGKGLKVLFSGASGTGKTMTAGVIAKDLGLDMYKIDLSGIVSKYIGETEKNLDRIFRTARAGNAILFFDEADALFGRRSEVKDAHDRYANVEVAYLLMKLEEHEGLVILASNLSENIDEAFSRRMHYVVEFPLPDETYRESLWRSMFPPETPLGENVDFPFLAHQFPISGGDIRNVALDAAFLAAQNGQVVTMKELVNAMARQMSKERKVVSKTDFMKYYEMIEG